MNNMIKQIIPAQYTDSNGRLQTDVVGLHEGGMVYKWHRGTGKWIPMVITNQYETNHI